MKPNKQLTMKRAARCHRDDAAEAKMTPLFARFRDYFDALARTGQAYFFLVDMRYDRVMISENWAEDFAMPQRVFSWDEDIWQSRIHPDDREPFMTTRLAHLTGWKSDDFRNEYRVQERAGGYVWMRSWGSLVRDDAGKPSFLCGVLMRMDATNEADRVTGLLGRVRFEMAINEALEQYRNTGVGGMVLIVGLDNFKVVNETYNRVFGDRVLQQTAEQFAKILPDGVRVYKLDGDEFGVVLPGADEEKAQQVFQTLQASMSRQQFLDERMYLCTISGGVVAYPQGGREYTGLCKHAGAALDLAKRSGKNQLVVFSRAEHNRWIRYLRMRDTIQESVKNGCKGFSLFYQPQVKAKTGELYGAEVLLRWYNEVTGRMVAPMEFIPVLEETQLILPVGKWILETSLNACKRWREQVPSFRVSVNVSYAQIKDVTFFPFVMETLKRLALPTDALTLELTESTIVADWTFLNRQFDAFRAQGISIAMDDFGTGYSSLAYLKNLSCDIVKLDREFVKFIRENDFDREIVEYTVALCHRMGITVCIEGVEDRDVYELVTNRCKADAIQGYLFGRPVSETEFCETYIEKESEAKA